MTFLNSMRANILSLFICSIFACNASIESYGNGQENESAEQQTAPSGEGGKPTSSLPITEDELEQAASLVAQARQGQWTYVPIPHAVCGNGCNTGIGINLGPASSNTLLIFYQGGGACSDALSCYVTKTATYVEAGYDETTFSREQQTLNSFILTQRTSAGQLSTAHLAYFPYCTGDIHGGNNTLQYPGAPQMTFHQGGLKSQLSTAVLAAAFPNVNRVVLSGSSAGGLGSVLHFGATKGLFAKARVDLLSDSGVESGTLTTVPSWKLLSPSLCTDCEGKPFSAILPTYAGENPASLFAAMSFATDTVLPSFSGQTQAAFAAEIAAYFQQVDKAQNARTFTAPGAGHVVLNSPTLVAGDMTVKAFVEAMLNNDPTWHSVP